MISYGVRFRGHWCATVNTGFARKPILVRARKGEEPFEVEAAAYYQGALAKLAAAGSGEFRVAKINAERLARMECARAIKRTNCARQRLALLVAHSTLAGESLPKIKTAARLMADSKLGPITRRGKVWKIVVRDVKRKALPAPESPSCVVAGSES